MPAPNYCIAGLGNPGERYNGSRHNLGFRVADEIARERSTDIRRLEYQALTAGLTVGRSEVLLMKPQTYMNRSGESVAEALATLALDAAGLFVLNHLGSLGGGDRLLGLALFEHTLGHWRRLHASLRHILRFTAFTSCSDKLFLA